MTTLRFSPEVVRPLSPKPLTGKQEVQKPLDFGPKATGFGSSLPSDAWQAARLMPLTSPRFGATASSAQENSLYKALAEIQVEEMKDILTDAKALAKKLGHGEVSSLHVLAVQLQAMLKQTKGKDPTQLVKLINSDTDSPTSLWLAHVGPLFRDNGVQEVLFYLNETVSKVNKALEALPKAPSQSEPALSETVVLALQEELEEIQQQKEERSQQGGRGRLTPEKRKEMAAGIKQGLAEIQEQIGSQAALLEPFDSLLSEMPQLKLPLSEMLSLTGMVQELRAKLEVENPGVPEENIHVTLSSPMGQKQTSLKKLAEDAEKAKATFWKLAASNKEAVEAVFGQDPVAKLTSEVPDELLGLWLSKLELEAALVHLKRTKKRASSEAREAKDAVKAQNFEQIVTAPFQLTMKSQLTKDPQTAKAQALYRQFIDLLSGGMPGFSLGHMHTHLQAAKENGAGDAEIKTLNRALSIIKHYGDELERKSRNEEDKNPAFKAYALRMMQQASEFAHAYSDINWHEVRSKEVDLTRAKKLLDANKKIPTPIKRELLNFVKHGNRNGWQQQPMLLLVGDYGTQIVKDAVIRTLGEILGMPVHQPTGEISSAMAVGPGGRVIKNEVVLSPPARAIVENKTPQNIVYIDNLLRFIQEGGMELFDQFASHLGRKSFEEPDLDIPLDVRPFVFVAALEDGSTGNYLSAIHGDRFNDHDITLVNLGEDIDTFTKERVAEGLARQVELKYNVRFGPGVVETICRDYAILARHDMVEETLRNVAKAASGAVDHPENGPLEIKLEDLEPKWLGPKVTRSTNRPVVEPTIGSMNGLAAGGAGFGCVMQIGVTKIAEWGFNPVRDKQGRYHVKASLGPVTTMTADSVKKASESFIADLLNDTISGYAGKYKLIHGLRHKAMTFQVTFPENVDGPSAGALLATCAVSSLTGIPIRSDVALTGTIADKGHVGPIGGIFGKTRAAYEAGIKKVLMPESNYIELQQSHPRFFKEVQEKGLTLVPVNTMDEVLKHALTDYDALLKPPTEAQLQLDTYDPLGTEEKASQQEKGLEKLLKSLIKSNQTNQTQLLETLTHLVAALAAQNSQEIQPEDSSSND